VKKEYDQSAIPQTLLGSLHQTSMIVSIQSQIECLLEEMRIKVSIVVSDLLGSSGLRILHALANGETDAKSLALLGDDRLKCTEEQLVEALTGRWLFAPIPRKGKSRDAHSVPVEQKSRRFLLFNEIDATP
jgi:hypothetical protein